MNEREWWELVTLNWQEILNFCAEYLPMDSHQDHEGNATTTTVRQNIVNAFKNTDPVLSRYLTEAWIQSPEDGDSHIWSVMSDLYTYEPWSA